MEGNIVFYNNVEITKIIIENVPIKRANRVSSYSNSYDRRERAYCDTRSISNKYRIVVKIRVIWFDKGQIQCKDQSFDVTSAFEMPDRITDRFRDLVDVEIRSWDMFLKYDKSTKEWSLGVNTKAKCSRRY